MSKLNNFQVYTIKHVVKLIIMEDRLSCHSLQKKGHLYLISIYNHIINMT